MRRKLIALAALGVLLVATACDTAARREMAAEARAQQQGPPPPSEVAESCEVDGGRPKIGVVPINLQALFFNQIITGAEDVAQQAGVDVQVVNGDDDSQKQANAIDDLVANNFDAIIVDAVDTDGIRPAIRRADAAGVPVVAVDAVVDDEAVSTQVGTANVEGGRQLGEQLLKLSGGDGDVGIVGALNSTVQLQRQKGFTDRVTEGGMAIRHVVDGRNIQEQAQTVAENLLTGNPDLPYAYATGEPALIGLAAAVASQQRSDDIEVVGWDLSAQAVDGLRAGWIKGVVQQNTFEFGYQSMNAAIDLVCGRDVPADVPVPTQIVTPENVSEYLYYLERG
ncbi:MULTISPECIES: substrate-binding domain-containing protein [Prauserella salsuginis group]|uniref:Substrate-binding domain-containing protein n=1 Tax=Prauserella salsuginis TaxID=387889 RepID=A0ABW6G578_9PSEU|nr:MULTISPECIES: substrate-binding domain-containing protein [Prauserella salsuginis group]MCR3718914.1 ribose transport system substrate-binding protein [Prauserella flava]MCR3733484.1 ribose transport system substrate-binding protein [Prauserella salsuginis]